MKIALGTTSEGKRKMVEEVLDELGVCCEIENVDVKSSVSDQPISSTETKRGSLNRARRAIKKLVSADCGLGIEVGYHPDRNGDFEMMCWASIVDKSGRVFSAQSHKIRLPEFHQRVLKENRDLCNFVRQYIAENTDPVLQHIGVIIRDRKPFIQTAVKTVLLYFLQNNHH